MPPTSGFTSVLHSWPAYYALWCVWLGVGLLREFVPLSPGWGMLASTAAMGAFCALMWPVIRLSRRAMTPEERSSLLVGARLAAVGGLGAMLLIWVMPSVADIPRWLTWSFQLVFGFSVGLGLYIVSHLSWQLRRAAATPNASELAA